MWREWIAFERLKTLVHIRISKARGRRRQLTLNVLAAEHGRLIHLGMAIVSITQAIIDLRTQLRPKKGGLFYLVTAPAKDQP